MISMLREIVTRFVEWVILVKAIIEAEIDIKLGRVRRLEDFLKDLNYKNEESINLKG